MNKQNALSNAAAFADDVSPRRAGLVAWGVVLVVLGAIAGVCVILAVAAYGGALNAFMAGAGRRGRPPSVPVLDALTLLGLFLLTAIAVGGVWTGIASCQARRWVRPIVMIASVAVGTFWLIQAVGDLLLLPTLLDKLSQATFERQRHELPSLGTVLGVQTLRVGLMLGLGVVVPWMAYRFYASPQTVDLLDRTDAHLRWTDRLPVGTLGWTLLSGLVGVSLLLSLTRPTLTAFVVVLRGQEAIIGLSVLGILLLWAAVMCYRGERTGWIVSLVLLIALRASLTYYLAAVGTPYDLLPATPTNAAGERAESVVPAWHPAVMAGLELAAIALLGLRVARQFDGSHRVGVVRTGDA